KRALIQRLGFGKAALLVIERGAVVDVCADRGGVGAKRSLIKRQRALKHRLGLGIAALNAIELGQVVEGYPNLGVVRSERLLANRQRTLIQRLGLGIAALGAIEQGEVVESRADRITRTKLTFGQGKNALGVLRGLRIFSGFVKLADPRAQRFEFVTTQ